MRLRTTLLFVLGILGVWGVLLAQKPFHQYPGGQDGNLELPGDWDKPTEFNPARLRYRDWGSGVSNRGYREGSWGTDYPSGGRHLAIGLRRLTRVDTRSVEQVTELDGTDDIYNWPFLYAVEVGRWTIDDKEGKQLKEFLLRGGFLMVDDFHGTQQWAVFKEGMDAVFPDRQIEDLAPSEQIFHILNDVDLKVQVANIGLASRGSRTYEQDGYNPTWRAVFDDKRRIIVAICHNMDLGDAWEYSDTPSYPTDMAIAAHSILQNYVMYDLTH